MYSPKSEIINEAKSANKWAASVAIAKLFENTPPKKFISQTKNKIIIYFSSHNIYMAEHKLTTIYNKKNIENKNILSLQTKTCGKDK